MFKFRNAIIKLWSFDEIRKCQLQAFLSGMKILAYRTSRWKVSYKRKQSYFLIKIAMIKEKLSDGWLEASRICDLVQQKGVTGPKMNIAHITNVER